ncbi:MAG: RpoL/Rpb11 RNA polymerase subunit family protein [Candidatus Pacearchaeota archaeon]
MITKILKNEKNYIELELNNPTIAELLRVFLWQDDSVKLAAWKREHPTKNPILIVKTDGKTAKKALQDCIERIDKLNDKVLEEFKKAKITK